MSDWPKDWDGVEALLLRAENVVIFPSCFRCSVSIAHEDLVEALTVILATTCNSHRHCILLNCPGCGQDVAVIDPLHQREREFAHAPTH